MLQIINEQLYVAHNMPYIVSDEITVYYWPFAFSSSSVEIYWVVSENSSKKHFVCHFLRDLIEVPPNPLKIQLKAIELAESDRISRKR